MYLEFIGIPRTQARNFYNLGINELDKGNKTKALEYLNDGLKYWNENYIQDAINKAQ